MRCGFQTLIWGRRIEDLDSALDQIAACGYEGVEVAQAPQDIWIRDPQTNAHVFVENISELLTRLNARGLTLIGLAGGRLDQRVKFCGTFRPEYLYQDNWDEETEAVTKQASPFTVGLHPHLFMPIHKLQQVKDILDKNSSPYLKFIPDTAHLTIAQDDPVQAVRMFPQRLAAVHLKDWNSSFGRYSHRYAHGFTGLGQGVVNLKGVVQALKELNFQGWIIAEQDSPEVSPAESALLCANWLATEGLPIRPDQMRLKDLDKKSCIPRISVNGLDHSLLERSYLEMTLLSTLLISQGQGAAAFYQSVTDTISSIISCTAVHLWLFSPADQRLLLVAATGLVEHITHRILDSEDFLVRRVAKAGEIQKVNLNDPATASAFRNQALLKHLPLQWLISVPIFNSSNPNHLRFVLNLFPSEWPFPDAGFLGRIGEHISRAGDSLLDQLCSAAAGSTSYVCGNSANKQEFLESLVRLVQLSFRCEGVAIFLINQTCDRLEMAATTGTEWKSDIPRHRRYYAKGEGLTGRAWSTGEIYFAPRARLEANWRGLSWERLTPDRDESLFAPIAKRKGDALGVIRCTNKVLPASSNATTMFTDDDAAVLEAIIQAALPHLELLLHQEREIKAVGRLTHEFQMPMVAIRGAVQLMQRTFQEQQKTPARFFGQDYLQDVWRWSDHIGRLLSDADIYRDSFEEIIINPEQTLLLAAIIAPTVNHVAELLRDRGFPETAITYGAFEDIPALWIDRQRFQQVLFNLLSNSIKYATSKSDFRVRIESGQEGPNYLIWYWDYGPGIETGLNDLIFQPGFRAPSALKMRATGQGLGLSVVRFIVEAHGGTITLTGNKSPTKFTITLPKNLAGPLPPMRSYRPKRL